MSLYRQHQHLARMVEWAETARIAFPATVVMDMAGVVNVGTGAGGHILVLAGAAAISWIGWNWCKRAKAALSNFEQRVNRSSRLAVREELGVDIDEETVIELDGDDTAPIAEVEVAVVDEDLEEDLTETAHDLDDEEDLGELMAVDDEEAI